MRQGQFDSDTAALEERIRSQERYGLNDLNEWIFSIVEPMAGETILDLGCGTGKQSIPLAHKVGERGKVISVDISNEAIDALCARAAEEGVEQRIRPICDSLDNVQRHVGSASINRVVASYSIYYVEDAARLFRALHDALSSGGLLFFCGPSNANNREIIDFHNAVKGSPTGSAGSADAFMESEGPRLARQLFSNVQIHHFENPICFDNADTLYAYWSSYNLYDSSIDMEFREAARRHFAAHRVFQMTKQVIGVSCVRE